MHRLSTIFKGLDQVINGLLTFGDGLTQDNILGAWVTVADTGAANTDFAVTHNLGQIPPGFLLMIPPVTGAINLGVTPWTKSQIFLRCSTANQKATFFVLGSPLTY
jgi:hypothetical protein